MRAAPSTAVIVLALLLLTASLSSACTGNTDPTAQSLDEVTLTGVLSVIRNGHDLFVLFDENNTKYELLIDDALLQAHGGTIAVNRKTITIRGVWSPDSPDKIIVTEIMEP